MVDHLPGKVVSGTGGSCPTEEKSIRKIKASQSSLIRQRIPTSRRLKEMSRPIRHFTKPSPITGFPLR